MHVFDVYVRGFDFYLGHYLACSEIRAARTVECRNIEDEETRRACARRHAIASTSVSYSPYGREYVDEVFDSCFYDNFPFAFPSHREPPIEVVLPSDPRYDTIIVPSNPLNPISCTTDSNKSSEDSHVLYHIYSLFFSA